MSNGKLTNFPIRKELKLKPYKLDLYEYFYSSDSKRKNSNFSLYEKIDLTDIRYASIKELTLSSLIPYTQKSKFQLKQVLSNINVKRINIYTNISNDRSLCSNKYLILISNYLSNNTTIKEITLICKGYSSFNDLETRTWKYFINTISDRLINISGKCEFRFNDEINKLLFSNVKLKKISLNKYSDSSIIEYSNVLKYIISSVKFLGELTINRDLKKQFFDDVLKIEKRVEINTLTLKELSFESNLLFTELSYLFETEILIFDFDYFDNNDSLPNKISDTEKILDCAFKLSNNPLNTLKKIIIKKNSPELIKRILLDESKYDIRKIPLVFFDDYREVVLQRENNNDSIANITDDKDLTIKTKFSFKNDNNLDNKYPTLTFKNNTIDEEIFIEFLNLISNNKVHSMMKLKIQYDDNDNKVKSDPQCVLDNTQSIIDHIKDIYSKFKDSIPTTKSKELKIKYLELNLNAEYPELKVFFLVILEIMIDMNIRIKSLVLENCSFTELDDFMNKYKNYESLKINNIHYETDDFNTKHIDRLYKYSHLIEGQIKIVFLKVENLNLKYSDIIEMVYSKNRKLHNFIIFDFNKSGYLIPIKINDEINILTIKEMIYDTQSIERMQKLFDYENHYCYRNINEFQLIFHLKSRLLEIMSLFSFFKEYSYVLGKICFYDRNNIYSNINIIAKTNSYYFETILDVKYREKETYLLNYSVFHPNMCKRNLRYLNLHNITKL